MAVCSSCGSQVYGKTAYCPACGASVSSGKKGSGKLIAIIAAIVIVVAAVVVCCFMFLGGGSGPDGMLKDAANAMNKRKVNASTYKSMLMNEYAAEYNEALIKAEIEDGLLEYDDYEEYLNDFFEKMYEELDDEYGDDWKVSFEVKKSTDLKKKSDKFEKCEELWDELVSDIDWYADMFEDYGYDESADVAADYAKKFKKYKLTEAREVKVKVEIKGDDDKDTETETIYFGKVNGKWVALNFDLF